MGTHYSALPINSDVRSWLFDEGIPVPDTDGSAPTPNQLRTALETLDHQLVSFSIDDGMWQAQIDDLESPENGPWTTIVVLNYSSAEEPCEFYFEKGWPELVIKVAHRISQQCGPIAIVPNTCCRAAVVEPDSDINRILSTWEHLAHEPQ